MCLKPPHHQGIHLSEEKKLKKEQEADAFNFKKKQELELQAFMKRQKEEASGFHTNQTNHWNDLKESSDLMVTRDMYEDALKDLSDDGVITLTGRTTIRVNIVQN